MLCLDDCTMIMVSSPQWQVLPCTRLQISWCRTCYWNFFCSFSHSPGSTNVFWTARQAHAIVVFPKHIRLPYMNLWKGLCSESHSGSVQAAEFKIPFLHLLLLFYKDIVKSGKGQTIPTRTLFRMMYTGYLSKVYL